MFRYYFLATVHVVHHTLQWRQVYIFKSLNYLDLGSNPGPTEPEASTQLIRPSYLQAAQGHHKDIQLDWSELEVNKVILKGEKNPQSL